MIDFRDPESSAKIRAALAERDREGVLGEVAAATGIAGGVQKLREIMNSNGEIPVMDRGMIGMHL
jgi:hypothetical protein